MFRKQKSEEPTSTYFFKSIIIFFNPSHDFWIFQIGQSGCRGRNFTDI